jgi:tetratricopeptide (TPR) repeat protein
MAHEPGSVTRDFFVSYTGGDLGWARWIAWELEAAGYTTILQDWDFQAGANFILEMHRAAREAERMVAVLSSRYLEALYTQPEWAAALVTDPTGARRQLLPVRIEEVTPDGLLAAVVYIDLVGLDEAEARARLRERVAGALTGRSKPTVAPPAPMGMGAAAAARPRFAAALPPVWNVPLRRNPTFTGREEALAALARQLGRGATAAVTQAQAIQGTGGIGKTALAVEYAYRHRGEFEVVWWVRAEEGATLVGELAELAAALNLAEAARADQQTAVRAVRRWLEDHDRWLLILDNAQSPQAPTGLEAPLDTLADLLPRVVGGQVLVTSRDASWDEQAELLELDLLTPQEAVRFLLRRAGSGDQQAAAEVAELVGYLTLALEQAGAYVRETRISLADYLQRLRQFPAVALAKGRPRDRELTNTVATTWQVSLDQLRSVAGAAALLEVCAFLAPDDVPRELFAQQIPVLPEELASLASDPFALDEAIAGLRRYSLVRASERAVAVHRLLQQVVRDNLEPGAAAERAGLAVRLLAAAFPEQPLSDVESWPACERLLPHALAAAAHAEQHAAEPAETGEVLDRAASYLQGRGRYQEARGIFDRALAATEAAVGAEHPSTSIRLNNLGLLLHRAGDPSVAKTALERALTIQERALGPDDNELGTTVGNLGQVLRTLGDLDGARQHHERALAIKQAALGPDHPDVAASLNNLGVVLNQQGDPKGARQRLERALAIAEASLGADHPSVGLVLSNLGQVLRGLGDLDDGRQYQERALAIREAALGPDHPDVAISLNLLGQVLQDLGDHDGARQHLQRALTIYRAALGPDHEWTQAVASRLADL